MSERRGTGAPPSQCEDAHRDSAAQHAIEEEAARQWARRPATSETVLLLDPDEAAARRIAAELSKLGVQLVLETEPFRAIARAGLDGVDLMIASAHLGSRQLETLVTVVRQEMALPVLIAHGAGDIDAIGPAVIAGARPVISLPYDARDVARVLRSSMPAQRQGKLIVVGELTILPDSHDVSFAGQQVDLSPLEFGLLSVLARNGNRAISRTVLARALWADADPANADDLLGAAVSRIRRKLRPLGIEEAVHTVRGFGYRLDAALLHRADQTPDAG